MSTTAPDKPKSQRNSLVYQQRCSDIWMVLMIFRFINVLCTRTFFQPDEYFQALEPAWQIAFGSTSGAWITWEWEHQLRSSLHPAMFAVIYYVADKSLTLVSCFPQFRAMILSVLPNIVQGFFAAGTDYFTWQLGERIYGEGSNTAWVTLLMTVLSPWNWFCSTRTFSNCIETTFTIAALNFWPWEVSTDTSSKSGGGSTSAEKTQQAPVFLTTESIKSLRISLILAATACILRPTNSLIWFTVLMPAITRAFSPATRLSISDYLIFLREAVLCGTSVLLVSACSDRLYFSEWTFPPYQWFNFNITQNLAVFYGRNDFHYFFSQGLPLLLTTYLPFGLVGLWQTTSLPTTTIRFHLLTTILVTISSLSLISHKEVRFIYPLLPLLHILAAPTINSFFTKTSTEITHPPPFPSTPVVKETTILNRKALLALLISANVLISGYTSLYHQRGVTSVITYLRHEFEAINLTEFGIPNSNYDSDEIFVAFLMPCHSTPWRSKLFYPTLKSWALTCSPPLHLAAHTAEREAYRDEADRFYDNPKKFLSEEVGGRERPWPRFVVGFEGIERNLREWYEAENKGFVMKERWRVGNTDWIDDSRRDGDVVVWEFKDGSQI